MNTLSIITPTYNRINTIKRLYNSLVRQSNYDFEWIVIDDGSTDSTDEYFKEILDNQLFKIVYRKVTNAGKHRALNIAMKYVSSEICICVDSDDWLTTDAVEKILACYNEHVKLSHNLIGIIAKRGYYKNNCIESLTVIRTNITKTTMYDFHYKYGCTGDTALIFKTNILKNKPFAEYENEKFLSEITQYYELDDYGLMYTLNDIVYLNEYQPNGLTANYKHLLENNPNGTALMYYILFCKCKNIIDRMKNLGLANYYYRMAKNNIQLSSEIVNQIGKGIIPSILGGFVGLLKKLK